LLDRVRAVLNLRHIPVTRPAAPQPAAVTAAPQAANSSTSTIDSAVASIRAAFADLDPQDWAEIQALTEARAAYRKTSK
jgi:hypothetical protein